jgi:glycosyltransferase involved in cell wall biosynthesis
VRDPSQFTPKGRRFFAQALRLTRRDADLVLCSSEATRQDCLQAAIPAERLRLVPLGVDRPAVEPVEVGATLDRYGIEGRYVLSVGTHEPRKNLSTLIDAFRKLDRADVTLVLVGPAGWHVGLDELVRPVADRTRVLGFVPNADRDALYAGADAFCYPSLHEGFGLPVLEAMAQGTPVVTSAGTATEEAAGDAGIIVDPLDAGAIADALAQVLDDPALAARLGEAGRERAATFTWARTAELTLAAYRELA